MALTRLLCCAPVLLLSVALGWPSHAPALVEPPVTIDGPSADIRDAGGAAIASDGTGGIAYIKMDQGVPHVFVSRRLHGGWTTPTRADHTVPYDAQQVQIAASDHGRLLVVWVSQIATVHGLIRYGLYSAELAAGAETFSPALVVDPSVGDGAALEVDPSLAGTQAGRAIVIYRATTYDFGPNSPVQLDKVQLRPGDVMADVRVARYQGTRWSKLGAINRNPDASLPAPSADNAPRAGLADDGSAVVAWQERDQTGIARLWARRVFGTSLGPTLPASPTTWQGAPVTQDVDALALAVTPLGMAQVVVRVPGNGTTRMFANRLPVSLDDHAGTFSGAVAVDGGPLPGPVGPPAVAVADSGQDGSSRIGFAAGGALRTTPQGAAAPFGDPQPAPTPSAGAATALGQAAKGSTIAAWETTGADGLPAVAVRQEQAGGGVQTGVVAGAQAGDVSGLSLATNVGGDGVLSFLQGTAASREIVAEGVTAAPARFTVTAPSGWVRPRSARLRWEAAPSTAPRVTYTVLLDGDPVAQGLVSRALLPAATALGNGVRQVRVVATDSQGQAVASDPVSLKVDARPPTAKAAAAPRKKYGRHAIAVTVADSGSGVVATKTTCRFGDGSKEQKGHRTFRHRFKRAGRYVIRVVTRDKAGNATTLRLRVQVR